MFMLELPAGVPRGSGEASNGNGTGASVAAGTAAAISPSAATRRKAAAAANGDRTTTRILAVDDEPAIRTMLQRALTRAGHEVVAVAGGEEALDAIRGSRFDLLLIDHRMSGMDGIETYQRSLELIPELAGRAVIMSGDTLNPQLQQFAAQSGLRMLAKPFDVATVEVVIDEELERAARAEKGEVAPGGNVPAQSAPAAARRGRQSRG